MKKLISIVLIIAMLGTALFSMTGCGQDEENLSSKITEKLMAYQTDLEDSKASFKSNADIRDYLTGWAKVKGIEATVDSHDNVIMSIKSSKKYKDADPAVILCTFDAKQFDKCIIPMSIALYLAKNNESTGKLNVIFASENNHDFSGIRTLNNKYFTDKSKVFCLNNGQKNMWSTKTGARSTYEFTNDISFTAPTGDKAYKIKIKGLPGGIPNAKISSYPNPIKEIGDLLAYFKTNALIYELADVHGGVSGNVYPRSASATVVINEDDFDKFQSRMEKAIENFNDSHLEDYPEMTYTYEEVPLPDKVLTQECLNEFVIVLYTLIDGVYYKDDDKNLVSITSIGSISCKDNTCVVTAVGNSLSLTNLKEIDTTYSTICGLSNIRYKKTDGQRNWFAIEDKKFYQDIAKAFSDYSDKDIEFKDCVPATNASYAYQKNNHADIINVTVNEDRMERYTGTIVTFLLNQLHTDTAQ